MAPAGWHLRRVAVTEIVGMPCLGTDPDTGERGVMMERDFELACFFGWNAATGEPWSCRCPSEIEALMSPARVL